MYDIEIVFYTSVLLPGDLGFAPQFRTKVARVRF